MNDFNIRSDAVDVEQIMRQIRARIREKRGVDYTEEEIHQLAAVKLEQFLDPRSVRSDLVEHYRQRRPLASPPPPNFRFEASTPYVSSRGVAGRLLTAFRLLCRPVVKLIFNPNPVIHALNLQSHINEHYARTMTARQELDSLHYEVLNNLVVEVTRLGIELRNVRMRVESLSSRLDFDERRARALEQVVQYRPGRPPAPRPAERKDEEAGAEPPARKRRRRRGRRRGEGAPAAEQTADAAAEARPAEPQAGSHPDSPPPDHDRPGGPDES